MMSEDEDYDKCMPHLTSEVENGNDENGDPPHKKQKMILEQERFLPIANISRIMKRNLPSNGKLSKEAKECIQESVSEFISFLASEASDNCAEEKRKTITAEDLLNALRNLGFDNYHEPLKDYLRKYREANKLEKTPCNFLNNAPVGSSTHDVQPIRPLEPAAPHSSFQQGPSSLAPANYPPSTSELKQEAPALNSSSHTQTQFTPDDRSNGNQRIALRPSEVEPSGNAIATNAESGISTPFQHLPIIVDPHSGQQYLNIQQPNGQQALWPVQISSSINGAPVFTVTQPQGQQRLSIVSSSATTQAVTTASHSQMQPPQTVQSNSSTTAMVPTYSVTSSSNELPQVHFINEHENPTPEMCNSTSSNSNGSYYGS